jgi:N-carbamoyl-L-amino-acid hydrolase
MIRINPERFLADLDALRRIGGCGTGVVRRALTLEDMEGRRWLAQRMAESGLRPEWDPVGNIFGIAPEAGGSILIGSHADTQPEGGWLDGAYGVICGLEIARAAQECGIGGVSVVAFSDEEGHFQPLMGSRYWTGELSLADIDGNKDSRGRTLGAVRAELPELRDARQVPASLFSAFIEPHIEQGPVLDTSGEEIAVVTAIVGMRHVELVFTGDQNHAGTTPMALRRDALQAFVRYASELDPLFRPDAGSAVWTFGQVDLHPNAVSIVPGRVRALLQIRDGSTEHLEAMARTAIDLAVRLGAEGPCPIQANLLSGLEPALLDEGLILALSEAAADHGRPGCRHMLSGALHDASPIARILPAAMLFTPSINGKSHSFDEDTRLEHLVLGCEIVAAAAYRYRRRTD